VVPGGDTVMKMTAAGNFFKTPITKGMPSHFGKGNPACGRNETFSLMARFPGLKFLNMYYLHTWRTDGTRIAYFYQDSSDMIQP